MATAANHTTPALQDYRQIVLTALAGRSVYWLAKAAGVHQPTLAAWLGGRNDSTSTQILEKVAGVLGLNLSPQ